MTVDERARPDRLTAAVLAAGVAGGVLVTVVSLTLAVARPGFDMTRHANSMLVLGDWGWVQTVNFIGYGALMLAFAVGIRRATAGTRSGTVAAVCVAVYGLAGGIIVGLNPADPGFGFPPGAPEGYPGADELSLSARVHGLAGMIGFLAVTCGCFALARYFARVRDRVWATVALGVGLSVVAVCLYLAVNAGAETDTFNYVPTWVVGTVLWLFIAAVGVRLGQRSSTGHTDVAAEQ